MLPGGCQQAMRTSENYVSRRGNRRAVVVSSSANNNSKTNGSFPMSRFSRRRFLSTSAAAAGALSLGAYVNPTAAQESKSPSERLRIAGVGTTNRAGADLAELSSQEIVALADVDDNHMAKGSARYPEARKYRDFRV